MDLKLSDADEAFRAEVRAYFRDEYPQDILAKLANGQTLRKADLQASEAALNEKGWVAPGWPKEYGGPGWTITQRFIFDEELETAGAPNVVPMGLLYVAPVIYTFGTDEQKQRWLPDILASRTYWAQGYSEPDAGSDLASLRMSAVRDGDHYVLNGEKIWTSDAHYADWIFCLVRTSNEAKKQQGITFLCMDIKTPGITVIPIITIDGGHHLNRVTFENARVPVENRIGEEGKGWTYARHLLSYERVSYAHVAGKRKQLASLRQNALAAPWEDPECGEKAAFFQKMAAVEIQLDALEMTLLRALAPLAAGAPPGDEASILKIAATENAQAITELMLELADIYAQPFFADRSHDQWRAGFEDVPGYAAPSTAAYFITRAQTIYGGTTEVQKNIIARQLGLTG
jgi:alkylation response protein AidB-like acyl-CoA dehydrogenase